MNNFLEDHVTTLLQATNIESIYLLTYGNGSSLAVDVVQRQIVRCAANPGEEMRIRAIAAIEPSQVREQEKKHDRIFR